MAIRRRAYTIDQAAEALQISRRHRQALIKRREHETGLAYCIRLGRCVRFTDQDIARLERAITITLKEDTTTRNGNRFITVYINDYIVDISAATRVG